VFDPVPQISPVNQLNHAFSIVFSADADAPFPQVILRGGGREHLFSGSIIEKTGDHLYRCKVPEGLLPAGEYPVQVESCRIKDISRAGAHDWIKAFDVVRLSPAPVDVRVSAGPRVRREEKAPPAFKIYFGIHKHMHQPYYNTSDERYWDGEKDSIFGTRKGAYAEYLADAIERYEQGGLPAAGISTSWSGSLIEQLNRCESDGLCGGQFNGWKNRMREAVAKTTARGNPRLDFTAFGFFHPLMPLIPPRDIVRQILWHRSIVEREFGLPASRILFPPETAFHVRMIPALKEAGIDAVIYDSLHRARACKNYPYAGSTEGMLPPNQAEQENDPVGDWYQLRNVWAGSKISPGLLKPEYVHYDDPDGKRHKIIAVPAERYLGNEDARGGYGALQYPDCFSQLHNELAQSGEVDPAHPPFFLLHSDGDNYGGGTDSYYRHNTEQLVRWLSEDDRFELISIRDYLERFPPDPAKSVHIEPGSWAGADNGDPQFAKWFSRYRDEYSPDLNSWSVLTAFQNVIHSLEDAGSRSEHLARGVRLMLLAETSCYWYWTGQDVWDQQVTQAANLGCQLLRGEIDSMVNTGRDRTGPSIFPAWVLPENPGGMMWGQGGLTKAPGDAEIKTFVYDLSGVASVNLVIRTNGSEKVIPMANAGTYPSRTGTAIASGLYAARLPAGMGTIRYFIEATDNKGNRSRSSLERLFLA